MRRYRLTKILISLFFSSVLVSCSPWFSIMTGQPTPKTEMDRWNPPSEQELSYRREKQLQIDAMEAEIQARFLFNEKIEEEKAALLASLRLTKAKTNELEPSVQKKFADLKEIFGEIEVSLEKIKLSKKELLKGLAKYKDSLIPKKMTARNYVKAIRLFQLGNYKKSIFAFNAMLKDDPPRFLRDNIYFGLANAFYKQKKWKEAERYFKIIVDKYPFGNKWPASYLMLGLLYSKLNERSKALYILDKAQKKYLPDRMLKLIQKLRNSIQKETRNFHS